MPEAERFDQIDWTRLAQEQPADYVRMTAERDALRGRLGTIQQELQQVEAQANRPRPINLRRSGRRNSSG